jgi:EAL domain-containing protein (putative c-di-GMP-specific phosphodiesterase class I)
MGCEYGQGFYFSRAVTSSVAEAMIARQSARAGSGLLDTA